MEGGVRHDTPTPRLHVGCHCTRGLIRSPASDPLFLPGYTIPRIADRVHSVDVEHTTKTTTTTMTTPYSATTRRHVSRMQQILHDHIPELLRLSRTSRDTTILARRTNLQLEMMA